MGITIDCEPIKTRVKNLFGGVVRAMISPGGSIVASFENINAFLALNTPPDDLIRTDFKQEGVIPKVMLHVFEELVLLLGRHPFNNKVPYMINISGPSGELDGTPTLLDGRDTTKSVETNLVCTQNLL
nr:hypothetical protein [Tanacetum cinerariifolium]